jgi:hypothetical protein
LYAFLIFPMRAICPAHPKSILHISCSLLGFTNLFQEQLGEFFFGCYNENDLNSDSHVDKMESYIYSDSNILNLR